MISLELKDLARGFGERLVFQNISLQIEQGQCLVVTGRNGSGKSTLLRVVCGLLPASSGEVVVQQDKYILEDDDRRDAFGLVAPDLSLYDELTALENLRFFARVRGTGGTDRDFKELIARVGLPGRENDPIKSFSSGMKQRMKYAYALLHQPLILLLDEPTANLDEAGAAMVDETIKKQKQRGIVVIATNEPDEVGYGDKVIKLGI
jgi:heme exporter protein A